MPFESSSAAVTSLSLESEISANKNNVTKFHLKLKKILKQPESLRASNSSSSNVGFP